MTMPFTKRASAVVCSAFYAAVLGSAMLLPGFAEAGDVSEIAP
jgi:hypothetical protein